MAKKDWLQCAVSAALAFLIAAAAMLCLLTAFEIECAILPLLLWTMAGAVLWSVSFTIKRLLPALCAYALGLGYLWRSGKLSEGINGLVYTLSLSYNKLHGWKIMGEEGSAEVLICLYAVILTGIIAWTVCRHRGRLLPVILAALPLLPTFLADTATPQPLWLGLWLFGMGLLALSQPARKIDKSPYLTAALVLPMAVFALVLLLILPQNKQDKPREFARQTVQYLQETGIITPAGRALQVDGGAVELRKIGPRQEQTYPVMTVKSDRGGVLYLRGCAYDSYFQNNWTNLTLREDMYWPAEELLQSAGTVTVETAYPMSMRYFPYYIADGGLAEVNRGINNFNKKQSYSYEVSVLTELPDTYTYAPEHGYTQVPTVAMNWAKSVVAELVTQDMTDGEKIDAVTAYVKKLAKYSIHADAMPADTADFVVWFAQEADRGYCVHFATAGAVLLRAAGIPTRYVTGYMVEVTAGTETTVYGDDAHAWVECFLEGVGWIAVEMTPGAEPVETVETEEAPPVLYDFTPVLYGFSALILGALLVVLLRWLLGAARLRRQRKKGSNRDRLLAIYSQLAQQLAKNGEKPATLLEELAQRAKYSNHPVEQADLLQMEKALRNAKKARKRR